MFGFGKKKPERRFWCPDCRKVLLDGDHIVSDYLGGFEHRVWSQFVQDGVDFGEWRYHKGVKPEALDAPSNPTADGRLSLAGDESGRLTMVKS